MTAEPAGVAAVDEPGDAPAADEPAPGVSLLPPHDSADVIANVTKSLRMA
jgi:hypothetical protein